MGIRVEEESLVESTLVEGSNVEFNCLLSSPGDNLDAFVVNEWAVGLVDIGKDLSQVGILLVHVEFLAEVVLRVVHGGDVGGEISKGYEGDNITVVGHV